MVDFFIKIMIDGIEIYNDALGGNDYDFDNLFINSNDGTFMDDITFFKTKGKRYCTEEFYEYVYDFLVGSLNDYETPLEYDINYVIREAYERYVIYNSDTVKIDKNINLSNLTNMFLEDYDFGIKLIEAVYLSIIDEHNYNIKKANMLTSDNDYNLDKVKFDSDLFTINDFYRETITKLYNHYIFNGCSDIEALNLTWAYFINDLDPFNTLDEICIDNESKNKIKRSMLNIIFSDLYEDVMNGSIIKSDNYNDRLADFIPVFTTFLGFTTIPNNVEIRNRMLKHFILLQDEKEKLKNNRAQTYINNRDVYVKKVNPNYQYDDFRYLMKK